jgi:pimeloyl-ACP methyl ester carboxylesterase
MATICFLDPEAFREAFAADVDPDTAAVIAAAQRPYAAAAFAAAPSDPPAWKTLPCWYLLGTEDKAISLTLQRFMAERANATIVEVPASHVSFVSQSEAATQLHPSGRRGDVGSAAVAGDPAVRRLLAERCVIHRPRLTRL